MRTPSVRVLGLVAAGAIGVWFVASGSAVSGQAPAAPAKPVAPLKGETRLSNVRQLTFGGENAEAYFSFDGTQALVPGEQGPRAPATRSTR